MIDVIAGYEVAQIRLILRLFFHNQKHPLHLKPLAYIHWFSNLRPTTEPNILMYTVQRRSDGVPYGDIIDVDTIARHIQLIPKFGGRIDPMLNEDNSADITRSYYVNCFFSKETYQAVW